MEGVEMEHLEVADMWDEAWTPPLKDGATLSPWQKLGVTFLNRLRESFKYGLLGDDMGIGKVSVPNMRFERLC
jgi:hypothetical protein